MNAYFELTGLPLHEVGVGAELLPGGQPLLRLVLLQGARTPPPVPMFDACTTLAFAPPRVEARRSHCRRPLLVAGIDGRHVDEGGDAVELLPHLNCTGVRIEDELTFSDVARWRRSSEGNALLLVGGLEVDNRVSRSENFWNEDRRTLGCVLVHPPATFLLHLRGERDVVIQKLAVLDETKVGKYKL